MSYDRAGPLRISVISNIRLYREGLASVLQTQAGIEVVSTAADGATVVESVREARPDIVLLDMTTLASAGTVRALCRATPETSVVALAVPETERHVMACAEAGIAGYVAREASLDDLMTTIRSVGRGETICSPRIAAGLLRRLAVLASEPGRARPDERLTSRELQIVRLIEEGLTNKEIAQRLSIELSTVKNHVHRILEKLRVRRRTEVGAWARRFLIPRESSG